ncbi:MAG: HyaD/HybD family hydrogenase maturation endopeptidase [Magnetococcales bacterium]|nr:HyaD/HybD family hydrogenase maturation endopeptidase [Magnetococcales bacterium]
MVNRRDEMRIMVLGIGNTLMKDDGAGVAVVTCLSAQVYSDAYSSIVTFLDGGTLSFPLIPDLTTHDGLILVDAINLAKPPGTVQIFFGDQMDQFLTTHRASAHDISLMDLFNMMAMLGHKPKNRALIGIQVEEIGWGDQLTAVVERAIPTAVHSVLSTIRQWETQNLPFMEDQANVRHHEVDQSA